MKDKKIIILSIVGILMLVSIVVATSYAYFVANVSGNKDTNNVVVTNGVMALEYSDGDEVSLANAIPGSSVSKTFTVKNTGNVATNYTIYFSELSNKFVDKTDLVYTLTSSDGGKNVVQTQVPSKNDAMVSNYAIEAGKTHTYTLTITFLEKNVKQDDNQNVSFSTKLTINETKETETPSGGGVASTIANLAATDTINFATDDPDNNIRYIGADPNNYVYFNCSDYSNQSDSTCEKWRIIGVFKNMTKSDGLQADLVKIVRGDSLGKIPWDGDIESLLPLGRNNWSAASLQATLNESYFNGNSFKYYVENDIQNDNKNSLKNDLTRNAIESVIWNLGGPGEDEYTSSSNGLASHWYGYERGMTVYDGNPTTWTGKVGLMYPSDFGYATSGDVLASRTSCLAKELSSWRDDSCRNSDYLYDGGDQLTLTPLSSDNTNVFYIRSAYFVSDQHITWEGGVRPTVFLKSSIAISNLGDGTSNFPYQLSVN